MLKLPSGLQVQQAGKEMKKMELKDFLGEDLAAQVQSKIESYNGTVTDKAKKVKLVDLSEGGYVSKEKHTDKLDQLQTQVTDLTNQIKQRDTDLADLQTKLKDTTGSAEALQALQAKYDQETKDWQDKLEAQSYDFAIKEKAAELNFSSAAAKKAFIAEAREKAFKQDGDTLLGYNDWLKAYQAADPGAFVADTGPGESGKAKIVFPQNQHGNPGKKLSLSEMMQRANADPNYVPNFD